MKDWPDSMRTVPGKTSVVAAYHLCVFATEEMLRKERPFIVGVETCPSEKNDDAMIVWLSSRLCP